MIILEEISGNYVDDLMADIKFNCELLSMLLDKKSLTDNEQRLLDVVVSLLKKERDELLILMEQDEDIISDDNFNTIDSILDMG